MTSLPDATVLKAQLPRPRGNKATTANGGENPQHVTRRCIRRSNSHQTKLRHVKDHAPKNLSW